MKVRLIFLILTVLKMLSFAFAVDRSPLPIIHPGEEHFHLVLISEDALNDIDMGELRAGGEYQVSFEVINAGGGDALFKGVDGLKDQEVDHDCTDSLKSGESCQFKISIRASKKGPFAEYFKFKFLDKNGKEHFLGLSVTGQVVFGKAVNLHYQKKYTYQNVEVGSQVSRLLPLWNGGQETISFNEIIESGDISFTGGEFPGQRGTCTHLLRGQKGCYIEIAMKAKSEGKLTGTLSFKTEDKKKREIRFHAKGISSSRKTCFHQYERVIRANDRYNLESVSLPYQLVDREGGNSLELLYGTESNKENEKGILFNQNAQNLVLFPKALEIKNLIKMELSLAASSLVEKGKETSGFLCLSSDKLKTCSGKKFVQDPWSKLWSKKFQKIGNDFSRIIKAGKQKVFKNKKAFLTIDRKVDLPQLFKLKVDALGKIFHHSNVGLILAGDIKYERLPELVFTYNREVTCEISK